MIDETYRPRFHFLPPSNWINDPNGLIEWKGQYHLFYQYKPDFPDFGDVRMLWGHASSLDLVHWKHLPVVLSPDTSADKDGCWTGCAINNKGVPTLIYTGRVGENENVCLATSQDDLLTFQKGADFRLNVKRPVGEKLVGFRDPYAWREADGWYLVIGSGFEEKNGVVLLYRSQNLHDWDYLGPLLTGKSKRMGNMWECPNFFPLGNRYVLITSASPLGFVQYFAGQYKAHKLEVEQEGVFDNGKGLYAPQIFRDSHGREILFGWIWEELTQEGRMANGWAGLQSLPRELSLSPEGILFNRPVAEMAALRRDPWQVKEITVSPQEGYKLPVKGNCIEILARFKVGNAACGIKLACSPDGREETLVGFDPQLGKIFINRIHSRLHVDGENFLSPAGLENGREASFTLDAGEDLELDIFFDRSVLEVFANGRISLTSRIYPALPDSHGIQVFSSGCETLVKSVQVWQMENIW